MEKNTKLMYILAIFIGLISSLIFFIGFILGMVGLGLVAPLVSLAIWLYHAFIDFKAMKAVEEGKTPGFPINFNLVK